MRPPRNGANLRPPQAKVLSCQRTLPRHVVSRGLASRIGLSADVFQTLDFRFRGNDDVISSFFLKLAPLRSIRLLCGSALGAKKQFPSSLRGEGRVRGATPHHRTTFPPTLSLKGE